MRHNDGAASAAAALVPAPARANGTENIELSPRFENVDVNGNSNNKGEGGLDLASMWKESSNNRTLQVFFFLSIK